MLPAGGRGVAWTFQCDTDSTDVPLRAVEVAHEVPRHATRAMRSSSICTDPQSLYGRLGIRAFVGIDIV
jgi:hypothetical protein